jgi:hypothetical protein
VVQIVQSKIVAMNQINKTGKRPETNNPGRPANPPARFAFRLAKNGETTEELGRGAQKNVQCRVAGLGFFLAN